MVHREKRLAVALLLLLKLDFRLHHIAAWHLAEPFLLPGDFQEPCRLRGRLLRRRVLALGGDQRVVVARDCHGETTPGDVEPRLRRRFGGLRFVHRRQRDDVGGQFLVYDRPRAVHFDAVQRYVAAVRVHAVRLIAEILRRVAERRQQSRLRLIPIGAGDAGLGGGRLKLRVVLIRALERILKRQNERRTGRRLRVDERQRRADLLLPGGRGDQMLTVLGGHARCAQADDRDDQAAGRFPHLPTTRTLNVSGRYEARPPVCDGWVVAVGR